jgi:osmoprotectant transport system ATP-binding protein
LQGLVQKTVIFVTHDIDEAIRVGDRIAILREGGVLAQYDTPDEVLANPADEFVARFVGEDRGLRRLSLRRLADIELEPVERSGGSDPEVDSSTSLRNALSVMLSEGSRRAVVRDEHGAVVGSVSFEQISELLSANGRPE